MGAALMIRTAVLMIAVASTAASAVAAERRPDRLRVTAETVNTTDRVTPAGSFQVQLDCGPALRRSLVLSPARPSRVVEIPKGAFCRIEAKTLPLAPYPCAWETAYSPAGRAGGEGAVLTIRNTLVCRHGQ